MRRTKIEAGRYTAGWTRLNAGGRSEEEGDSAGGQDPDGVPWGGGLGVAGDSDGWGPDDRRGPVDGNDSDGEDMKWTINMSY
jgi:hypothetical protein